MTQTVMRRNTEQKGAGMGPKWSLLVAGWILVLTGGCLAHFVQTAGGVKIQDVRFEFEGGKTLSALVYRPAGATPESPAPGILAVHGYINSRETQSGFAIEFARRGYVVLAIDQTGHGFSQGTAFSAGFGGPAALRYLQALPFVDRSRIGLEGHSMGGWTSLAAAADQPDGYRSIALVGSSTGAPFAAPGTPLFPRNLGVIFSRYDEFSELMWGVSSAGNIAQSGKLKGVFGTEEDVEVGRIYGSVESGTARWLAVPATTHPGDHLSPEAIADAVRWMDLTLVSVDAGAAAQQLDPRDQIWYWKELGTLVALIGGVLILLGGFELLLHTGPFRSLLQPRGGPAARLGGAWWVALVLTSVFPAASYYLLTGWGDAFTPNGLFPQGVTNQILVWAAGNGLVALALSTVHKERNDEASIAVRPPVPSLRTLTVALLSVAGLYVAVAVSDLAFKTDMRFWVVALKPIAAHQLPAFLAYLLPFTLFFYTTQRIWHEKWAPQSGAFLQYATFQAATVAGFAIMVVSIYTYLLIVGRLPGVDPLFTIVAIQFVPILAITSAVSVFTWRRTGNALAGALISGLFVTWYIVAGQATHV